MNDPMMREEPDGRGLVEIALKTFREVVLPVVPAEQRFPALMIANALSVAARELAAGDPVDGAALAGLCGDGASLEDLCAAIEAGAFDGAERQAALRAMLWGLTRRRLAVSNPKYAVPVAVPHPAPLPTSPHPRRGEE